MAKAYITMTISGYFDVAALTALLATGKHREQSMMDHMDAEQTEDKPAAKPKTTTKAADPSPDKVAAKAEEKQPEQPSADEDALRAEALQGLQAVNKANGAEAVKAVLAEFGVKNISAVPAESLQALIDKCKEQTQ